MTRTNFLVLFINLTAVLGAVSADAAPMTVTNVDQDHRVHLKVAEVGDTRRTRELRLMPGQSIRWGGDRPVRVEILGGVHRLLWHTRVPPRGGGFKTILEPGREYWIRNAGNAGHPRFVIVVKPPIRPIIQRPLRVVSIRNATDSAIRFQTKAIDSNDWQQHVVKPDTYWQGYFRGDSLLLNYDRSYTSGYQQGTVRLLGKLSPRRTPVTRDDTYCYGFFSAGDEIQLRVDTSALENTKTKAPLTAGGSKPAPARKPSSTDPLVG